jgi:23S rRNA pseudouridine2605 synthase
MNEEDNKRGDQLENANHGRNKYSNESSYSNDGSGGEKRRRRRITRPGGSPTKITQERPVKQEKPETQEVRLNKFISNCGVCSRRDADDLIKTGKVTVNGEVVTTMGHKVLKTDVVSVDGKELSLVKKVYVMLNKPKDYITTTNDPQDRKTVMDLVGEVETERVYPVGRLDRNTTGILIFTNDGEISQKLMHPSTIISKIYSVQLGEPLQMRHFQKIQNGVTLFDGVMKPDKIAFIDPNDSTKIGVEIHSGRNRVVRRIFEALGYEVVKLDRVVYAGLDKGGLQKGKWRLLTEREISHLKRVTGIR